MRFSAVIVAALASIAQAVDVQVVSVASTNNTLKFFPEKITAAVGSMVQFQFRGGNHTVTQSTFDQPCVPINQVNSSIVGIFSGYQPVAASASMGMVPVFTVMINNTNPVWLYCSQGRHCQNGMVMVINEPANNPQRTLDIYKQNAASGTTGGGSANPSGTTNPNSQPTGAAAGLAVPGTLGLAVAAALLLM